VGQGSDLAEAPTVDASSGSAELHYSTQEHRRADFQVRLAGFLRFLFVFAGISHTLFSSIAVAEGGISPLWAILHPGVAVTLALGLVWWWTRRGPRALVWLRSVDVTIVLLLGLAAVSVPLGVERDLAGRFPHVRMGVYFMMMLVLIRSALVPSTLLYTSLLNFGYIAPMSVLLFLIPGHLPWLASGMQQPGFEVGWLALFVAASTYLSHVIWGLRERVRTAEQLGQYRLESKLGEGGMGVVYRASHAMLRRDTAVKLLKPDRAGEQSIKRFEREVQMTAKLTHPNTVEIYDYGRTPDGVFYYAMELLDGTDLAALVKRWGPMPPERVVHILLQVCGALAEAHEVGLVHRDIKPANIIMCRRGRVPDVAKIVDFGLVKRTLTSAGDEEDASLTGLNQLVGTPQYMAPEAIASADAQGPRSDLYALGATAFFMLTGEDVFRAKTIVEVCGHHLHTAPEAPSVRRGQDVGEDLDAIVLRCLEKDPEERWENADSLAAALEACSLAGAWTRGDAAQWWDIFEAERHEASEPADSSRSLAVDWADR